MRNVLLLLLILISSFSFSGCAVALVGAGAGAVAYLKGDFESIEPHSVERVFLASKSALADLGIAVISDDKDALSGQITGRDSSDDKVSLRIERVTDASSKLSIRVSVFGDESKSRTIYLKIRDRLNGDANLPT